MKLELSNTISEKTGDVIIAVDSNGVKVTNRGEWMREKWKVHRGWIKVHIAVDVETEEVLAIEVTDESVSDSEKFNDLLNGTDQNIGDNDVNRVLGDGAYATKEIFNILNDKQIKSGIKTRVDASTRA